jgi:hypothetical protein
LTKGKLGIEIILERIQSAKSKSSTVNLKLTTTNYKSPNQVPKEETSFIT